LATSGDVARSVLMANAASVVLGTLFAWRRVLKGRGGHDGLTG
jgi:phosphate/sulfate permease